MMFYYKEYQKHDNLVSSVTTKMKGVAVTNDDRWYRILLDAADHSALSQGPESGTTCSSDKNCTKGYTNPKSNGVQTGKCNELAKTCEVFAWCPTEKRTNAPKYVCYRSQGGVIAIQINWECDLDWLLHKCVPEYSFRRLDEKNDKKTLFPGFSLRFARYYIQDRMEVRTLFKVYGIRFDVMVTGKTILVVDFLLTNYIPRCGCKKEVKSYYTEKKYEAVEDQTEHQNESTRECLSSPQRPPSRSEDTEMQERQTGACSEEHETSPSWRPMTNLEEELSFHSSTTQCISTPATFSPLVLDRQTSQLLYRNPQLNMPVQVAATLHLPSVSYREVFIQYD
ncbi:P2X purinoceptor 7 [Acipenser ruthenus]|uniref:P2X purinoceptor 7 n=1 Tax=Acipenser ruthenus TaxID=7906 RepID=A0A444UUE7_ACIRT|nr:P2X purinoceptor 7 [Acipenser ruthenus]